MDDRYLLYIDVLGFSDLVKEQEAKINDLYEVIASLNVHDHDAFKTIIFSDTILVYNLLGGHSPEDKSYLVMFLCEFAQDLQHRLTGRNIYFRAILIRGSFTHYELNAVPCFFGTALIDAYRVEKQIKAVGLFIDKAIEQDSDIFRTATYNEKVSFVFITQRLHEIEFMYGGEFPIQAWLIEETDSIWHLGAEIAYLKDVYSQMRSHPDASVREKYENTWRLFKSQYPKTLAHLEATQFDLEKFSPGASWKKVMERYPEDFSWAVKTRKEY